jgi:exodeoxyribonuclease V beta subunit
VREIVYSRPAIVERIPIGRNALIEASAGTGKTFTIERLIVRLLIETDTTIDRILVVTFTEKATGELRARIRATLERILEGRDVNADTESAPIAVDENQARKIDAAIGAFDRAPIHTIHSFCRRVLTELAFATGSRFELELIDARKAFHEAMRVALRERIAIDEHYRELLSRWLVDEEKSADDLESVLYQAHQHRYRRGPAPGDSADDAAGGLTQSIVDDFLPIVEERLATIKEERGLLDYDDMLAQLGAALSSDAAAALIAALRERYACALIDEFQDTDDLQWQIFSRIFVASHGTNPIFLIGDPKQAIYSFRGADVYAYLAARRQLADLDAKPIPLTRNFRATRPMVEALNRLLDQRAPEPFFAYDSTDILYDHPVTCGQPSLHATEKGRDPAPITVVRASAERASARSLRYGLGRFIAREIRAILNDPARAIEISNMNCDPKRVAASDIFVLTRTIRESEEIGAHLRAHGVPFAFYKQEGLFQTSEASDILDVLGALADPSRRSNRLRAWGSPFFGVPYPELPGLLDPDAPHDLTDRLMKWKSLGDAERFAELFDALLNESGLADRELLLAGTERELTNYQQIFEILIEEAGARRCSLAELVELLDDYFHERALPAGSERNIQRLDSERASVQVMTIHKAKGLEADVVFLYGGTHKGNNPQTGVWVYHENGERQFAIGTKGDAKDAINHEEEDEDRRLSYVAITRARARLYLPYFPRNSLRMRASGYYKHLNRRLDALAPFPVRDKNGRVLIDHVDFAVDEYAEDELAEGAQERIASWNPPAALLDASQDHAPDALIARLHREHRALRFESYTSLSAGAARDLSATEPEGFKRDTESDSEPDAADLPGGANVGLFLHEVIEQLDLTTLAGDINFEQWQSRREIRELFERAMRLRQVTDRRWLARAEEIVFNTLRAPTNVGGTVIPGLGLCNAAREMEFVFPMPERDHPTFASNVDEKWRVERGFVTGFVDFVFRHQGLTYFADWKSDLLHSYQPEALEHVVRERYEIQKIIYSIGVTRLLQIGSEQDYEERFGGLLYVFIRGVERDGTGARGIYFHRPTWDELRGYAVGLERSLGRTGA